MTGMEPMPPPTEDTGNETVSRCTTETATGAHTFEIVGYSLKKGIGKGKSYKSGTFTVGGYAWALRFCPDGLTKDDHAWLHLELVTPNAEARAWYRVRLLKWLSGAMGSGWTAPEPKTFSTVRGRGGGAATESFQMKSDQHLEASGYIRDDCLTVRCEVTVIKEATLELTALTGARRMKVPPPNMAAHYGGLLAGKEGADVTLSVGGELFPAHKVVLFARSPVFKGQLLGPMRDKATDRVVVDDVQPEVFWALLHFIYTDSMPDLRGLEGEEYCEMIRHLLVAADLYAMERLKMICQTILAKKLDTKTVATTLGLADLHNCDELKDVCIEYLNSSDEDEMQAVMETEGYANLKRSCPSVLVEVFERSKRRRT